MVGKHSDPNVYDIKPVFGKGPVCNVNQHQLQDLKITKEEERSKDPDIFEHGCKCPYLTWEQDQMIHPQLGIHMHLAQKEDLQCCH